MIIAALYVQPGGCYYGQSGVVPWGLPERDARLYPGPWPVVAHSPCERWGQFATGNFKQPGTRTLGDDGGCFASALESVRRWGGVLEHPRGSRAWRHFGLNAPPRGGGWVPAGDGIGVTCCVEQGWYGHLAQKPTWLYAAKVQLPELLWGTAPETWRLDESKSPRWKARAERDGVCVLLSSKNRAATPPRISQPANRNRSHGLSTLNGTPTMKSIAEHSPCHLCGHPMIWAGFYRWQCTNARCRPRGIEPTEVDAMDLEDREDEPEPPPDEPLSKSVGLLLTCVAVCIATFWIVREVRDRTGFYFPSMEFVRQSSDAPGLGSAGVGFGQHQREGT